MEKIAFIFIYNECIFGQEGICVDTLNGLWLATTLAIFVLVPFLVEI
jgi:hypothetical protein